MRTRDDSLIIWFKSFPAHLSFEVSLMTTSIRCNTSLLVSIVLSMMLCHSSARSQPIVDGTVSGDESFNRSVLSVQNTRTQFGDGMNPDPIITGNDLPGSFGGSEID